jgi:peptide/nickel transport system ATP-binding protein
MTTAAPSESGVSTPRAALLDIAGLSISARSRSGLVTLVDGIDLRVAPGERVAIVGESGSGKSVTARAVMHLDPELIVTGSVSFHGTDLLGLREREMQKIRGRRIGMVFQDPMEALNPLQTIGQQVTEPLRIRGVSRKEATARAHALLDELEVARAAERMRAYPHEFSGGMRQRVVMAMALIGDPELLIADEPTTALDVRVQDQVLTLLKEVQERRQLSVVLITHDLGVVAGFADRVVVMYAGRIVEQRDVIPLFESPAHPYTQGLLLAVPRLEGELTRLQGLPGSPPSPAARPEGCAFHPRCSQHIDLCCELSPNLSRLPAGGEVACHLVAKAKETRR